jgi:hypothetical protein
MAMRSSPDRCLLCDDPWTGMEAHRSRGLHPRCYNQMRDVGRLDEFPILRYRLPARPPMEREEVVCLTPDCDDTVTRYANRMNKTYRCARCKYAKLRTGGYDHRLLARYDQSLPPMERVLYWLDPDNQQQFRGIPTPFVKPGGPDGDCLVWQRQLHGNTRQMATGNTYPKVHWYKRQERAHRIVYSVLNDIPLEELLVVDHRCEIKQCINPAHLGAETLASNTAGRIRTRRHDRLWNDPDALRARLAELEQAA